jgi:hypothetical protein
MALGKGEHTWLYRTRLGRVRKHEGQPVLEAGASVYRLGPRCRTRAQMYDLPVYLKHCIYMYRETVKRPENSLSRLHVAS